MSERRSWQDETLGDLRESARRIVEQIGACRCPDEPHQNAMHDLATDVLRLVPHGSVLLPSGAIEVDMAEFYD